MDRNAEIALARCSKAEFPVLGDTRLIESSPQQPLVLENRCPFREERSKSYVGPRLEVTKCSGTCSIEQSEESGRSHVVLLIAGDTPGSSLLDQSDRFREEIRRWPMIRVKSDAKSGRIVLEELEPEVEGPCFSPRDRFPPDDPERGIHNSVDPLAEGRIQRIVKNDYFAISVVNRLEEGDGIEDRRVTTPKSSHQCGISGRQPDAREPRVGGSCFDRSMFWASTILAVSPFEFVDSAARVFEGSFVTRDQNCVS